MSLRESLPRAPPGSARVPGARGAAAPRLYASPARRGHPRRESGVSPSAVRGRAPYGGVMDARDPELKKELAATLQARKDLGAEYESELVDSFMEKVDQR